MLTKSLSFYAAQRSGYLGTGYSVPWRGDSGLTDISPTGSSLVGGYYDNGGALHSLLHLMGNSREGSGRSCHARAHGGCKVTAALFPWCQRTGRGCEVRLSAGATWPTTRSCTGSRTLGSQLSLTMPLSR